MRSSLALVLLAGAFVGVPPAAAAAPAARVPQPPALLPGSARASSASAGAEGRTWIVGARPGSVGRRIAKRFGARQLLPGTYLVRRARARKLVAALRRAHVFFYAEPNRRSRYAPAATAGHAARTAPAAPTARTAAADSGGALVRRAATAPWQPLTDPFDTLNWWRSRIVSPTLVPPPVTARSPTLYLIDSQIDVHHREFAHSNIRSSGRAPARISHGTATMAVAAAPINGVGITGTWPDMRAVNLATDDVTCSASARQIARATAAGAATINMSYGSEVECYAEYVALQRAVAKGIVLVAAAGNEYADGNPLEYPASLPHVLTVAATGKDDRPTYFSNANAAIDLSAPGESIVTDVPPSLQPAGRRSGAALVKGTSFSAPMVAAAATWVRAARPTLSGDQIAQVIRFSARDVGRSGWEPSTGYGVLDIAHALAYRPPPREPSEPNDDIVWVDGRGLGRATAPIFSQRSRRPASFSASLDEYKDPTDVYRVLIAPHRRIRITARPVYGDTDLALFGKAAKTIDCPPRPRRCRGLLRRSRHAGTHLESMTIATGRRGRTVYVAASITPGVSMLNARYVLTVRQLRRR